VQDAGGQASLWVLMMARYIGTMDSLGIGPTGRKLPES
jgi:hypothetical protein